MPIKGLSDRRRLPRLGKIHLGIKAVNPQGVEYPTAVDYFVVPDEVKEVYGAKPTSLDIMFPVDDEELVASQFYRAYSRSRGLVCKGDGENANRLIDSSTKAPDTDGVVTGRLPTKNTQEVEWVENITCPGTDCEYYLNGACRILMNLMFMLPDVPGLGVWQLDTSSYNSIININSGLALVQNTFGRLTGIPLTLSLVPREVSLPPDGRKKTVRVLQLRSTMTLRALMGQAHVAAEPVALPSPDDESPEQSPTEEEREAQKEQDTPGGEGSPSNQGSPPPRSDRRFKTVTEFWNQIDEEGWEREWVTEVLGGPLGDFLNADKSRTYDDAYMALQEARASAG